MVISAPSASALAGPAVFLDRPRLVDLLTAGIRRSPVTVLSAPAGYGKSVLLRQLAAAAQGTYPDDDIPALQGNGGRTTVEWSGRRVEILECGDAAGETRLPWLLAQRGRRPPAGAHLLLACRPGSSLTRWLRSAGPATVIDEADLAFTGGEVRRLVDLLGDRELSSDQVEALMVRTAGWPLAVRVAALGMRSPLASAAVIAGVRGGEAHISAYFRHEVLDRQPAGIRRFLLRTSVLDHLDERLCGVVDGGIDPASALRRLQDQRLFVETDPARPGALRYQRLFREALRSELDRSPAGSGGLLAGLAGCYVRDGRPDLAAPVLIETERWDQLLALADRHGVAAAPPAERRRVLGWLEAVPVSHPDRVRAVGLRRALVLTLLGQSAQAEQALRSLEALQLTPVEGAMTATIKAMWVHRGASPIHSVRAARTALLTLGADPSPAGPTGMASVADLAALARLALGRGLWLLSAVATARQHLWALAAADSGDGPVRRSALGLLALVEAWSGDLTAAWGHAELVLAGPAVGIDPGDAASVDSLLAVVHVRRERGDLRGARRCLDRSAEAMVGAGRSPVMAVRTVESALWYLAAGQPDAGLAELSGYDAMGGGPAPPLLEDRLRAAEVRLSLARGDLRRARSAIEAATYRGADLQAAAVQEAVARQDLNLAQHRLDRWSEPQRSGRGRLEREFWTAIVESETGRRRQALRRAARVVNESEDQGYLRLFLDNGPAAQRVLRTLARAEPSVYATRLAQGAAGAGTFGESPAHGLSRREQEIIRYLPTPLSSAQIASRLYISVNTLKTHLRTIYRKLGVTGRRQAAGRAQELGLA